MSDRYGISQPVRRREDVRFLTGRGSYTDDVNAAGQVFASFVRSPFAHGVLRGIDSAAASRAPGVVAVFTGADLRTAGLKGIVARPLAGRVDMDPPLYTPRPGLAQDVVRHVGEPVVMVVAATRAQADDAAALVSLDIAERPAVTAIADALAPGAPAVWDTAPDNIANVWHLGDTAAADAALAKAAHITQLTLYNNRILANPMEVRTSLAAYDAAADRYTLTASNQGVQYFMEVLCQQVFDFDRTHMRVLVHDVGGGFGVKEQPMPEDVAILYAAKALGRPVKWSGSRAEHFLSDNHSRDAVIEAALALDADGNFTALRVRVDQAMGAYFACNGVGMPLRNMPNGLPLVYRTPIVTVDVRLVMTHTNSVGPYRGAGREQAAYIVERLIDEAARETGRDPVELRRRNLIPAAAMPYTTPVGRTYDSGEFEAVLDRTLALADWDGYATRKATSEAAGRLRGRGIACYLENVGGFPHEGAKVRFNDAGGIDVIVAAQSQGQGHETSFVQVVAARLGVPFDDVTLHQGDSDEAPRGIATIASRSMIMTGSAMANTCDAVIVKGKRAAGHLLEAAAADIEFADGRFRVAGTDRGIALVELAARLKTLTDRPADVPDSLDSEEEYSAPDQFFPNGCHVCEIEIDPDTGRLTVDRYTAVDDVGIVINPMIVHGQVHGGVAQGLGQALGEAIRYGADGQLLTGSFMDYAMPRADEQPAMAVDFHEVPCPTNPLGVKGVGEAGMVGALPAAMNAVADALAQRGRRIDFDMPATPENSGARSTAEPGPCHDPRSKNPARHLEFPDDYLVRRRQDLDAGARLQGTRHRPAAAGHRCRPRRHGDDRRGARRQRRRGRADGPVQRHQTEPGREQYFRRRRGAERAGLRRRHRLRRWQRARRRQDHRDGRRTACRRRRPVGLRGRPQGLAPRRRPAAGHRRADDRRHRLGDRPRHRRHRRGGAAQGHYLPSRHDAEDRHCRRRTDHWPAAAADRGDRHGRAGALPGGLLLAVPQPVLRWRRAGGHAPGRQPSAAGVYRR